MVKIDRVLSASKAASKGVRDGDILVSINGYDICDVLDYRFRAASVTCKLVLQRDGKEFEVNIKKGEYDDLGLEFDSFLMDEKRSCRNKCIFCFIDQNPKGMRESIYFKDDDTRLSFIFGNYVTLTNVTDKDIDRLCEMHISPINISVHTTDDKLRCFMLGNRFAGGICDKIKRFIDAGIKINCQIVLCRGVNDGEILTKTLLDLVALDVYSISVVPAGLTDHRDGLYPLTPFSADECRGIIAQIEALAEKTRRDNGEMRIYCSDEFYIKAQLPLHGGEYYGEYAQLDNGVGLISSMRDEIMQEIEYLKEHRDDFSLSRKVSVATGAAAYAFINEMVEEIKKVWYNIDCKVYRVENHFYGKQVTVAGLLTGSDYYRALKDCELGECLYFSQSSLRSDGDLFLDGMSCEELSQKLGVKAEPNCGGTDFLYKIIGE